MEIVTEYLVLFFLFDCFYLSAMTFDFLLVYVIDLKGMTMMQTCNDLGINLELKIIIVQILH